MFACANFVSLFYLFYLFQHGSGTMRKLSKTAAGWSSNVLKDEGVSRLGETEPGFDLNDEDMAKFHIWPMGVIPYYIDDFSFDKVLRDRIRIFLERTNVATGLHFMEIPRPPENTKSRWVLFINRQGIIKCAGHSFQNFTNEGVQKIVLGYNCLGAGEELAEVVLLLVGVPPMHNAPDRDTYVTVETKNILPGKEYLFEKLKDDEWLFHDIKYDFDSAGHFALHEYTKNGEATIVPKITLTNTYVGESKGFSKIDIWKIRMLYNYISKEKEKNKTIPECNKIFTPGSNLSNYQPDSDDDITPRKKPNKYLNLPEEKITDSVNVINKSGVEENEKAEENIEKNNNDSAEEVIEDANTSKTEHQGNQKRKQKSSDSKLDHKRKNKDKESFMQMSDFRSDTD